MRLNDVADQLRLLLPQYTNRFSETLSVSSITVSGSVATIVTTSPHKLTTGKSVIINGVGRKTPISDVSNDGLVFNFETGADHDQTMNWYSNPSDRTTLGKIVMGGFTNTSWNGSHDLQAVPNRRNFKLRSALPAPVLTGSEYILEISAGRMYGAFQVTVINATSFSILGNFTSGQYLGGVISKNPRVAVAIDGLDVWSRIQTPLQSNEFAIYVLPTPVATSKDRTELSDAVSGKTRGTDFRLKILSGFSLLIIAPTHAELSAGVAIDVCRHELRGPIYKCLAGAILDSGTSEDAKFKAIPIDDAVVNYEKAILVYSYEFQVPFEINGDDTVPPAQTSAFRDISYTLEEADGMNAPINLDDEPLNP